MGPVATINIATYYQYQMRFFYLKLRYDTEGYRTSAQKVLCVTIFIRINRIKTLIHYIRNVATYR